MKKYMTTLVSAVILIAGFVSTSFAGHGYHGCSMKMSEMSEIDSNDDGVISFEEFSAPTNKS
jgi:hypothetical protein